MEIGAKMDSKDLSKNQKQIISLYEQGLSFEEIAQRTNCEPKIVQANYWYAVHKLNGEIANKDTVLNEKQEKGIRKALEALTYHLRELNEFDAESIKELSYNPNLLIDICQEMSDKVGGNFNGKEFMKLKEKYN